MMRQAYGVNQIMFGSVAGDGSGQTIAIIDAYNAPTITSDLHAFDAAFGLSDPTLSVINENGGTTLPGTDPAGRGNSWAIETSLDVEWAHAIAPGAKILLVEANSASTSDLMAAVNTARKAAGVSVVSMSWGGDESSSDPSYNSYFTTPAGHQGVTFLASAGDSGAYGSTGNVTVGYPAASPNVIAVGGTSLNVDSSGNYLSESGWGNGSNSDFYGGGGGGLSTYEAQPTYQKGVVTQSTTKRALPDVAMDADPNSGVAVYDSYDSPSSPWVVVGGTSLAAPMWAGLIAITDQGRVLSGQTTLDGATQTLPKLYALPSTDFHDITTGNNGYAAGPGFDLVTGRGTPIANKLVPDLVGTTTPTSPTPVIGSFSVSPTSVVSGASFTLTASNVTEIGGAGTVGTVKFYLESNGSSGLQTASDTLIGTGVKNGTTWTFTASSAGLAAGTYTYYAVATDAANVSSVAPQAYLTIVSPTIGSFTTAPSPTNAGTVVTLTASNVTETGGTVSSVVFYRESNGIAGYQAGSDTVVGTGVKNGSTWTTTVDTTGFAPGTYTYYAVATDAAGSSSTASTATLTIAAPAASNDNFANGTVITGTSISVTGSNVNATREAGEPRLAGNIGGRSVWWTWTAPSSGAVTITTAGSSFDTMLGVYTGTSVSSLTQIAANDDVSYYNLTSAVTFNAVAGTTYHIRVDGYSGASGNIVLNLTETVSSSKVSNNNFANAFTVTGTGTWFGSNIGATRESGEPLILGNRGGASVWYTWTAPASGVVTIDTEGSDFDTMLAVYTGASLPSLRLVASNDDISYFDVNSAVTLNVVAGQTYRIQIDGYNGATGNIVLNIG
jgi:hypothetical protein